MDPSKTMQSNSEVTINSVVVVPAQSRLERDGKHVSRKRVKEGCERRMASSRDQPTSTVYLKEKSPEHETDHFIGPLSKKYIAAERERNKCVKPLQPKSDWLFAFMDLEGVALNLVEIAVIVCDAEVIKYVRLYHLKVKSRDVLKDGSRHCHGIEFNELTKLATHTEQEAADEIRVWMEALGSNVCVVSADEQENSDVSKFVDGWNVAYVNFPLPRWQERISTRAHILAQANKSQTISVHGVTCPYRTLHQDKLLKKEHGLSLSSGAHCGLADSYELHLHIKFNHLWNVLKRLAS
jgi:hypothetical protein